MGWLARDPRERATGHIGRFVRGLAGREQRPVVEGRGLRSPQRPLDAQHRPASGRLVPSGPVAPRWPRHPRGRPVPQEGPRRVGDRGMVSGPPSPRPRQATMPDTVARSACTRCSTPMSTRASPARTATRFCGTTSSASRCASRCCSPLTAPASGTARRWAGVSGFRLQMSTCQGQPTGTTCTLRRSSAQSQRTHTTRNSPRAGSRSPTAPLTATGVRVDKFWYGQHGSGTANQFPGFYQVVYGDDLGTSGSPFCFETAG